MIPALSLSLSPASLPCLSLSCRSMRQSRLSLNDGIKMRGGTRDPPHRPSPCLVNAQRERDFSLSLWVKWWWHSDECLRVSLCSVCVCHSDVCVSLCSLSLCVCVCFSGGLTLEEISEGLSAKCIHLFPEEWDGVKVCVFQSNCNECMHECMHAW